MLSKIAKNYLIKITNEILQGERYGEEILWFNSTFIWFIYIKY